MTKTLACAFLILVFSCSSSKENVELGPVRTDSPVSSPEKVLRQPKAAQTELCAGLPAYAEFVLPSIQALRAAPMFKARGEERLAHKASQLGATGSYPAPRAIRLDDGRYLLLTTQAAGDASFDFRVWSPTSGRSRVLARGTLGAALGDRVLIVGRENEGSEIGYYGLGPGDATPRLIRLGNLTDGTIIGTSAGLPVVWRRNGERVRLGCLSSKGLATRGQATVAKDLTPVGVDSVRGPSVLLWKSADAELIEFHRPRETPTRSVFVFDTRNGETKKVGHTRGVHKPLATGLPRWVAMFSVRWGGDQIAVHEQQPDLEPWNRFGKEPVGFTPVSGDVVDPATGHFVEQETSKLPPGTTAPAQ